MLKQRKVNLEQQRYFQNAFTTYTRSTSYRKHEIYILDFKLTDFSGEMIVFHF